ncbi:MAG: deoxyribodipyrimidine photolyase [Tenericutes bacterium HGW-Tenericutes-5]|jgi:deoxyribodipyrimidine photo-lyase|nr:MAG: deoxyribodipyrimidine photolyase [Tenericutes bacterium HGW-Tenericutes-5]
MSRILKILEFNNDNKKCLYIMTKSFRIRNNYSLYEAINHAKFYQLKLEIVVVEPYEENPRNIEFFEQNTIDLVDNLKLFSDSVKYVKRNDKLYDLLAGFNSIFVDKAYLRFDINQYEQIKQKCLTNNINLFTVESNVFVPVSVASDKEEYSARTIRNKINSKLNEYRISVLDNMPTTIGEKEALRILDNFIENKLDNYHLHNDPSLNYTSLLSAYLKYGFISPVTIFDRLAKVNTENKDAFLEELIVRRELAYNFVYFNPTYDQFQYMTYDWAYKSMNQHLKDKREYIYSKEDYINFNTHDPYFNAAMIEMVYTGRMHSYMRMYWCKKIIEWSRSYEEAYDIAIELNNYYFIDGFTPNGYCGVAWCFGKHDRAWTERPIFGKLRYMNDNGLKRKFNIEDYVVKMNEIRKGE